MGYETAASLFIAAHLRIYVSLGVIYKVKNIFYQFFIALINLFLLPLSIYCYQPIDLRESKVIDIFRKHFRGVLSKDFLLLSPNNFLQFTHCIFTTHGMAYQGCFHSYHLFQHHFHINQILFYYLESINAISFVQEAKRTAITEKFLYINTESKHPFFYCVS